MAKKRSITEAILSFLPRNIDLSKEVDYFNSTLLFVDISGFTSMSEKLANLGREGSEEVNRIINNFFSPLIQIVYKYNGDILHFAGDAFLSHFKGDDEKATENGMLAAIEIIGFAEKNSSVKTKMGTFNLKLHIALNKGKVFYIDLKNRYFFCGNTVNELMKLVDLASSGEIVVSESVKKDIKNARFKEIKGAYKYINGDLKIKEHTERNLFPTQDIPEDKIKCLIPDWLLKRIKIKPEFDYKDGEHRKITFVFLHFSGIPYDSDKDKSVRLLRKFNRILKLTADKYDGWVNRLDVYKDSERAFIIFGFPIAYEDQEERALLFINEIINNSDIKDIKIRAGVNSGFVFISPVGNEIRREYTIIGDAVNLCARIASSADIGNVFITEEIYNRTYDLFEYESIGAKEYKGKKDKIPIFALLTKKKIEHKKTNRWISESEKLVNRKKEIEKIKELINLSYASKGQIIRIVGEPGIGKSRLTEEMIKISEEKGFSIFVGNCVSYGSSFSYHPFINILNELFGISLNDPVESKKEKIAKKCEKVNKELVEWLPLIGEIMGIKFDETKLIKYIDAKTKKQRINEIIFELVRFESNVKPINIIIEDMHWADSGSIDVINYIGRNIENEKILLTLVYRPIERIEEFMEKEWSHEFILKELSGEEISELITNLLYIKNIPEDLWKTIVEKSQGNPFYVEELIKSLIEQGVIIEEKEGWSFNKETKEIKLPDTLESLILSRIDRLAFQDKNILQICSVFGKEFDEFLIMGLIDNKNELNRSIQNLQRLDLLKKETKTGEVKYYFKHILTREVTYNTISYARREELHKKTALYIEKEMQERKDEFLHLLSYHFYMGKDYEKSLIYSVLAGERAKKIYANKEAIEFFTRAIESYERLNDIDKKEKKELYIKALEGLGDVEHLIAKYDESIKRYEKIKDICVDDIEKIHNATYQIVLNIILGKDDIDNAKKIIKELLLEIDRIKEKDLFLKSLNILGVIERRRGNYDDALKYLREGLELSKELNDKEKTCVFQSNIAHIAYNRGDYDTAIEMFNKSLELVDREDMIRLGQIYSNLGLIYQYKKELDKALEYYNLCLKMCEKIGYRKLYAHTLGDIAVIYKEKKDYNTALEYLNMALSILKNIDALRDTGIVISLIGTVYFSLGEFEKSLEYINNSLSIYNKLGDKRLIATSYQKIGEIYIKLKRFKDAYEFLKKSEEIFEKIKNKPELEKTRELLKEIEKQDLK